MTPKMVLIVDDEPHIRYMLEFKLQQVGFDVMSTSNAAEAFELARKHCPDLVITDYQMPGTSGLELCVQLAASPQTNKLPALLLTARAHKVPMSDLQRTNVQGLVAKPFSPRDLIKRINEALGLADPEETRTGDGEAAA